MFALPTLKYCYFELFSGDVRTTQENVPFRYGTGRLSVRKYGRMKTEVSKIVYPSVEEREFRSIVCLTVLDGIVE